jgi:hypothetical protein
MKTDILKKLIKEAVREVFQEEMKEILLEAVRSPKSQQVVTETVQPIKPNIPVDIRRDLRSIIGGEFDAIITANSSMIQPAYTPPPVNTIGEVSSLPEGEVNLDQIMNLMNNR